MSSSHRNSGPGQHTRAILNTVDDSGPQQLVEITGLNGQTIGEAVRSQPAGLSTVPPKGAEGTMLLLGAGADRVHALGLEHPQYRPRNQPEGAAWLYQTNNNANHVRIVPGSIVIAHDKQIVLQVGNNSLTIDQNGFHFANGSIDHDGHKIDKTHEHTEVTAGSALTGPPQ